ncbi:MAG TPA: thioesterase family protein [Gammaproteobacteria bacterium]|nr:thioesterase family protein [Gammaproteobacteria bacterium]
MDDKGRTQTGNPESRVELRRMEIPTRFSDVDAQGHINNLAYLEYMQECRVQWFLDLDVRDEYGTVVVNTHIEYLQELFYPGSVTVIMTGSDPGRSSFMSHFEIWAPDENGTLSARGYAKMVFIDPEKRKSVPLPDIVRNKLK